jgi:large repetitive protein
VNVNGTFDTGDKGIVGVTVRLTGTDAAGNAVTLTTTTLADGTYSFPNVPAPNAAGYTLTEDQTTVPAGLFNGTTNVGTITPNGSAPAASGAANNASSTITGLTWTPPAAVTTAPQAIGQNYNFGEVQGANISGTVIRDTSRNGTVDPNEPGIAGVTVTLCRTNNVPCPAGDTVSTVVTATDGTYSFPMVPAGNYFVIETQPNTLGDSPGSPNARPVTVATTDVTNVNFLDMPAELSGAVYRDNNNNGLRDSGEPGIAGISVRLTGTDIAGNLVTLTTTTDASGNYIFRDLPAAGPAGYTVVEASQPAQTADSAANPGTLANAAGAPVTVGVGTATDRNTLGGVVLPPGGVGTNYLFGDVPSTAGVSGTVWRDNDHDRRLSPNESVVPGWTVQLIRTDAAGNNPVVVGTAITDANGRYSFTNLPPGTNYQIVFRSPDARDANGQPALYGTPVNGEQGTGTAPIPPTIAGGIVQRITLVADTTVIQQSLPLDPGGVVYDSITRLPVAGAQVTIQGPPGFNPAIHLVGGAANATQTVGTTGEYQFLLLPTAPAGNYTLSVTPPTGYTFTSTLIPPTGGALTPAGVAGGVVQVVPRSSPPVPGSADPTTYYLSFNLTPGSSPNVVNNHIPLDPAVQPKLAISKTGDRSQVEIGDSLRYTVTVRRTDSGAGNLPSFAVTDTLPAGFRYIPGTLTINGTPVADTQAGLNTVGPALPILVNFGAPPLSATGTAGLAAGATVTINYRVRVGVGAAEGTGINKAQARINPGTSCAATPALCSNEAQYKVTVTGGVFTKQACIVGKVYIDCNNNQVQDAEELGIPGVRLYLNDGTFVISDSEGKYSLCDLAPRTWVLKADNLTLPKGSRLVTSSSRNVGDAGSLFLDLKNGDLMRADFIEGSCSNTVLEEAKARRTQGEIHTPAAGATQTEKKSGNVLKFKGKAPGYAPEGTDSADQPLVKPRTPGGKPDSGQPKSELNTPVPQQKDAFSGSTTSDEEAQKGAGK